MAGRAKTGGRGLGERGCGTPSTVDLPEGVTTRRLDGEAAAQGAARSGYAKVDGMPEEPKRARSGPAIMRVASSLAATVPRRDQKEMIMSNRTDAIGNAFMRWLEQRNEVHPNTGPFLNDPTAEIDGERTSQAELDRVLNALEADELITGTKSFGEPRLSRVQLTQRGKLFLVNYDGDLHAWRAATGSAKVNLTASGNVQSVTNSTNVSQVMHSVQAGTGSVNHKKYTRAATTLLDELNLPAPEAAACQQAAKGIITETEQPAPDDGQLRRWGATIVSALGAVTSSAAGGTAARYIIELLGIGS